VVQDIRQLERGEPNVQRHHDGARLNDAVISLQQLMSVEAQVCDAVAVLDTLLRKSCGQALAALAELSISELPLAGNDPDLVAKQVDRAVETPDGCQRNKHAPIVHAALTRWFLVSGF
jgi:hypothetical protein